MSAKRNNMTKEFITGMELGRALGVSKQRISQAIETGRYEYRRIGTWKRLLRKPILQRHPEIIIQPVEQAFADAHSSGALPMLLSKIISLAGVDAVQAALADFSKKQFSNVNAPSAA